jgi:hypothetical protein
MIRGREKPKQKKDGTGRPPLGAVIVLALVFPAVAAVAAITYGVLRRRWPDRALAWLLVGLAAPGTTALLWLTDYAGRWTRVAVGLLRGQEATAADWLAVVTTGAVIGPVLGALYWSATQRRRERSPYSGADETERRQRTEERRRRLLTHRVQTVRHTSAVPALRAAVKPFAVPLGDELGPFIGRAGRGDLGGKVWTKGGRFRLPLGTRGLQHLVVLGGTGLGKTEMLLGNPVEWALRADYQVIYLSCKEPPGPEDAAAPRLVALAESLGKTSRVLIPGYAPFDPMRGGSTAVRDRLVKIEEWGDRYWQHCANLLVGLALELSVARGKPIQALPELVYSLISTRLKELADGDDPRVKELVAALDDKALSGALIRYASMAMHLREWVAPPASGGWSFEDADVICAELPTSSRPEAAAALLRLIVRDFGSYLVSNRRQRTAEAERRPLLFIVEEVGAVAGDPVIGKEFVNLVERARSANGKCVLSAQDPQGLGDDRARDAILTNASVVTFRQIPRAQDVAHLAGTTRVDEGAALFDQEGDVTAEGSTRRQHASKINPQWLRELGRGECYVIHRGEFRYVSATMSASGYATPTGEQAAVVLKELRRAWSLGDDTERRPGLDYRPRPAVPAPRDDEEDQDVKPAGWPTD